MAWDDTAEDLVDRLVRSKGNEFKIRGLSLVRSSEYPIHTIKKIVHPDDVDRVTQEYVNSGLRFLTVMIADIFFDKIERHEFLDELRGAIENARGGEILDDDVYQICHNFFHACLFGDLGEGLPSLELIKGKKKD